MKMVRFSIFLTVLSGLLLLNRCSKSPAAPENEPVYTLPALHTESRWIMNDQGEKMLLRGVNIPGLEWDANESHVLQSFGIAVDEWGCNLLRIPLSQDRWYGHGPEQRDNGVRYRALVDELVERALDKEVYIWLELHWNNAGEWGQNIGQHKMPDSLSVLFWRDLAALYKNNPAVLFEIYNEPYNVSWEIWKHGGTVTEDVVVNGIATKLTYRTPGHQTLLDEIRATGANNLVIASGLDWGFDLSGIRSGYALDGENIVYDTHPYPWKNTNWDYYWGNTGDLLPLIVGEWGGDSGDEAYFKRLRDYMKARQFCWTAWCFHADAGPQMLENWNYTPTYFGAIVKLELSQ
ncbi:cellulase family glycosylhydrolase [bacterium]|nr:cellulase family glycosylhydrolase [bacterium]